MLRALWMKDSGHQKPTQVCSKKSWLFCARQKELVPFYLCIWSLPRGKILSSPSKMPTWHNSIDFAEAYRLLLKRELGIPGSSSKANSWVSTKCSNTNTSALGIWEWSGTSIPARPIPKFPLQFKSRFACGLAYSVWRPVKAAPPGSQPLAGCRLPNSGFIVPACYSFLLAIPVPFEMYVEWNVWKEGEKPRDNVSLTFPLTEFI